MPKGVYKRNPASLAYVAPGFKRCSRCKTAKPLDQFHVTPNAPAGRNNYCKNCNRLSVLESQYRRLVRADRDKAETLLVSLEERSTILRGLLEQPR